MLIKDYHYPLYNIEDRRDFRDMLDKTCEKAGNEYSFLEKDENNNYRGITFNQFRDFVQCVGEALYSIGLKPRDKVGVIGKNCIKWAYSYYAIVSSGFIIVPIDKEIKENEIEQIVAKSKIRGIVFENKYKAIFDRFSKKFGFLEHLISFDEEKGCDLSLNKMVSKGKKLIDNGSQVYRDIKLNPKEVTSIIFTSGTTGNPKGVMLSQRNIISNIVQMRSLIWIDETMTFLSVLPLHHVYECTCGFLCQVHAGTKIAYAQSLKKIGENIAEAEATNLNVVPLLLEAFYKRIKEKIYESNKSIFMFKIGLLICSLVYLLTRKNIRRKVFKQIHEKFGGKLDIFISGGAAVRPEISKFFRNIGIRVLQGYGITECSPFLAGNRDRAFNDASAGMPSPGIDIEIFDKNEDGIGEVGVKGENVMIGYYEEPELTKKAFYNGYFLTGDYGYLSDDNFLYLMGRKKDIIVTKNGKNIYPEEVEWFYSNSDIIKEIAILEGIDPETSDETIVAHIYPDYERLSKTFGKNENEITDDEIIPIIKKEIKNNNLRITAFKRIKYFSIHHTEFEKTTTKKIKRFLIEEEGTLIPIY